MSKTYVKMLSILVGGIFLICNLFFSVNITAQASPRLSYDEIGGQFMLISTFETQFELEVENRVENIKLASKALDGSVIFPDDEFSFNGKIGERSALKGYKLAKVIVNSKYQDDFGGGVCQVSTTLFNAVVLADLKITESHKHTFVPSYVKPSFDAMVSYGYRDLRFKNDSKGVILIKSKVDGNKIRVEIYGTNPKGKYQIERVSIVEQILPFEKKTILEKDIGENSVVYDEHGVGHLSFGINGVKSSSYVNCYENGILVKQTKLRTDTYKTVDEIIVKKQSEE